MRALPLRMRHWLGAKLLLHLTLAAPSILLFAAVAAVRLALSPGQIALLVAYPLSSALLTGTLGLTLNLRFPRFDWTQEVEAVKNGLSVLLTMFTGMLIPVGVGALAIWLGNAPVVLGAACAVQLAISGALWAMLVRARMP